MQCKFDVQTSIAIIVALKARYKSKLLRIMVRNLENYDQLRQLGAAPAGSVKGLYHAYPQNLLDIGLLPMAELATAVDGGHVAMCVTADSQPSPFRSRPASFEAGWPASKQAISIHDC